MVLSWQVVYTKMPLEVTLALLPLASIGKATAIRIISSRVALSKEAKASTGTVTIMVILRHFHNKLFYNADEY